MTTETRWAEGTTWTVNGATMYKLQNIQSTTSKNTDFQTDGLGTAVNLEVGIRVWKRAQNGTETEITGGSPVAVATHDKSTFSGLISATYNVPSTALNGTDCIVVRFYRRWDNGGWFQWFGGSMGTTYKLSITEQLNAQSLDSATWTVYYFVAVVLYQGNWQFRCWFGSTTYNTRIENFAFTPVGVAPAKTLQLDGLVCILS